MNELFSPEESAKVLIFAFSIIGAFFLLVALFWLTWKWMQREPPLSPYSGMPLRRASSLSFYVADRVIRYMATYQQYDNRVFNLRKAAFCRETGRIFADCVTWYDEIKLDWSFLQKRYPGSYISWGSLTAKQRDAILSSHDTMEGFQTELSSPEPSPLMIEPSYSMTKPGPLYVDLESRVFLGWKIVPGTEMEVLIVQKPSKKVFEKIDLS